MTRATTEKPINVRKMLTNFIGLSKHILTVICVSHKFIQKHSFTYVEIEFIYRVTLNQCRSIKIVTKDVLNEMKVKQIRKKNHVKELELLNAQTRP